MLHFLKKLPDRFGWIIPLFASILLKLFLSFQDAVINTDGVLYLQAAQMIAEGHFTQSFQLYPMPAYPLLIALVHSVVPDWILAAKFISLSAAAAVTVPVYFLTGIFFDHKAAFFAAMAAAVLPSLNDITPDVIRDPCYLLLACWSVYWMVKALVTEKIRWVFGAFVVAGIALLFRVEAIVLFVVYSCYLAGLSVFVHEQRLFAMKSLLFLMIPALVGMIGLLNVGSTAKGMDRIDQLHVIGRRILSGEFFKRYQEIYTHLKESEQLSPLPSGEFFKLARTYLPFLYVIGLLEAFLKSLFVPFTALLWVARRYCLSVKGMPLVLITILFFGLLVLGYFFHIDYLSSRYVLLCALLALPLVGQGAVMLEGRCRQFKWRRTCLTILAVIFLLLPLYRSVAKGFGQDRAIALAGQWLSERSELKQAEWALYDLRYYIYADKKFDYLNEKGGALSFSRLFSEKDYGAIESNALSAGKEVIIVKMPKNKACEKLFFKHFKSIKQIESARSVVTIYADPLVLNPILERSEETVD